jgi:hypothetical protein
VQEGPASTYAWIGLLHIKWATTAYPGNGQAVFSLQANMYVRLSAFSAKKKQNKKPDPRLESSA